MTPEEFRNSIVPFVYGAISSRCLCAHPGFRKLLSFNFVDYCRSPMALVDSEMIIDCFIRTGLCSTDSQVSTNSDGDTIQYYTCADCGTHITEFYAEFSVSMYRTYCKFDGLIEPATKSLYLVGIRGFDQKHFERVHDFSLTTSTSDFLSSIGIDEQTVAPKPPPVRY